MKFPQSPNLEGFSFLAYQCCSSGLGLWRDPGVATRIYQGGFRSQVPMIKSWVHLRDAGVSMPAGPVTSTFFALRYFGFITKHPADHRFACHVFVSEESTKPLAESVG